MRAIFFNCLGPNAENSAEEVSERDLESQRLQRLFDLWDLDHDDTLDMSEFALGMRKFSQAKDIDTTTTMHCLRLTPTMAICSIERSSLTFWLILLRQVTLSFTL